MPWQGTHRRNRAWLVALCGLAVLTGCGEDDGDDQAVATQPPGPRTGVQVSPESDQRVEQGVEGERLTIEGGGFDVDSVRGQVQEPNVLTIVNQDDTDYRFGIEGLLEPVAIPAGQETQVEFTTPSEGQFEGRLYAAESDEVIATVQIDVEGPGGV